MNLTKDILEQLIREQIEATLQEKASVVLQEEIDAVLQEYTDAELEAIAAGEAAAAEAGGGHIATGHERIGTGEEVKPPPPTRRVQGSGATQRKGGKTWKPKAITHTELRGKNPYQPRSSQAAEEMHVPPVTPRGTGPRVKIDL